MIARAWKLAADHGIDVVLPDPLVLRRAVQTVADGLRRIDWALTDLHSAGREAPANAELAQVLADACAAIDRVSATSDQRRAPRAGDDL
jgi:hypothetical protein